MSVRPAGGPLHHVGEAAPDFGVAFEPILRRKPARDRIPRTDRGIGVAHDASGILRRRQEGLGENRRRHASGSECGRHLRERYLDELDAFHVAAVLVDLACTSYCVRSRNPLTAIVLPLRSAAFRTGESLATMMRFGEGGPTYIAAGQITLKLIPRARAWASGTTLPKPISSVPP